jgi:hypothetical protein
LRSSILHWFFNIAPGTAPSWLCSNTCPGFDLLVAVEVFPIIVALIFGAARGLWWALLVAIPGVLWFLLSVHGPFESHERLWRARRRRGECVWCGRVGVGPGGSCQGCAERA